MAVHTSRWSLHSSSPGMGHWPFGQNRRTSARSSMDRATGFYPVGWGFESLRARSPHPPAREWRVVAGFSALKPATTRHSAGGRRGSASNWGCTPTEVPSAVQSDGGTGGTPMPVLGSSRYVIGFGKSVISPSRTPRRVSGHVESSPYVGHQDAAGSDESQDGSKGSEHASFHEVDPQPVDIIGHDPSDDAECAVNAASIDSDTRESHEREPAGAVE